MSGAGGLITTKLEEAVDSLTRTWLQYEATVPDGSGLSKVFYKFTALGTFPTRHIGVGHP
jgi:hypothetical protein